MTLRCAVLDFDGTLTDADAHAAPFHARSRQELAARMQWDDATVARAWQPAAAWVAELPDHAGWRIDGRAVCPAHADPYLIANSIVRRILEEHHPELGETDVLEQVFRIHRASYLDVLPGFRKEAGEVLARLQEQLEHVWVVTNSHPDTVASLLDTLELPQRRKLRVVGHASKFSVCACEPPDPRFDALPHAAAFRGIEREVLLGRGKYFEVLRALWERTDTRPDETLVAGDIFELDLAMPAVLGAHVHLVLRQGTLRSEREAVSHLARAACSDTLRPLLRYIEPSRA